MRVRQAARAPSTSASPAASSRARSSSSVGVYSLDSVSDTNE